MGEKFTPEVIALLTTIVSLSIIGLTLALLLLIWILVKVKRLPIPKDADFFTTLRYTPLTVVLFLDLLDMLFDFFAAPFAWGLLSYLNLHALRPVTVIEALIPGTQFIPTMTAAWLFARYVRQDLQQELNTKKTRLVFVIGGYGNGKSHALERLKNDINVIQGNKLAIYTSAYATKSLRSIYDQIASELISGKLEKLDKSG